MNRFLLAFALAALCPARTFDVISTNQGGVEVVVVPIHHGSLLLQFRGQALYIDPDGQGDYTGLPKADFIFFTASQKNDPATYASLRKPNVIVIETPLAEPRTFNGIQAESAGPGYIFTMAGRRFYVAGQSAVPPPGTVDAAFICLSASCAATPAEAIRNINARLLFPYRFEGRDLSALKSAGKSEIRLRRWY